MRTKLEHSKELFERITGEIEIAEALEKVHSTKNMKGLPFLEKRKHQGIETSGFFAYLSAESGNNPSVEGIGTFVNISQGGFRFSTTRFDIKKLLFEPFKNIRVKASLFVLLLLVLTIMVSYAVTVRIMHARIMDEVIKRAESLSRSIAATAGYSLMSGDILGLDNLVYKIKNSNQDIETIAIVNTENQILVHSDVDKTGSTYYPSAGQIIKSNADGNFLKEISRAQEVFFEVTSPVSFMEKDLGSVVLSINKSVLHNAQREAQKRILWVFVIILSVGTAVSILLTSFLTRPIQELAAGVTELKEGKKTRPLRVYSQDELGRLTESFNEMTALITNQKEELSKYAVELEESYVSTVKVLAAAIDARDHYTLGHSTRVAKLSIELGKQMGLSDDDLEDLEISCLFHDVGKIKIPDSILLKRGKLEDYEYREMMCHPEYGAEILSKATSLQRYIPAVRHHHEWYNGTGYPQKLRGEQIPISAAIASLADVFDAMTSGRPYREALSEEEALSMIHELSGKQFHPELTKNFIKMLKNRKNRFIQDVKAINDK